jgi:hypothetical protein
MSLIHKQNRLSIIHGGTIASMGKGQVIRVSISELTDAVDLGGSLAVASRGLYATGVSTDLNGKLF